MQLVSAGIPVIGSLTQAAISASVRFQMMNSTRAIDRLTARTGAGGWIVFLAHFLFILVAWTIVIKYLFPIGFSAARGEPLTAHIFWDLWPVAHLWMGWALLRQPSYTRTLAIVMSVVEIIIIVTLFHRFLSSSDHEWSIWRTNWFINKIFVLTFFVLLLGTFTFGSRKTPSTT